MHFVDEFWLGPEAGWLRADPAYPAADAVLVPSRMMMVRLVRPGEDEGAPLIPEWDRHGTPYHVFPEPLTPGTFGQATVGAEPIEGCERCFGIVHPGAVLRSDAVSTLARARWDTFLAGPVVPSLDDARAAAVGQIQTMDELEAFLATN